MIDVVVFDLDDTLYPEKDFAMSGFKAVSDWLLKNKTIPNFFELSQRLFNEGKRGNIFNLALDQIGVNYDEGDILTLVQIFRKHTPQITLFDDAAWAIDFFRHKNLAIITDGYYEVQVNKVNALGIRDKFATIIYTDEFGRECWKPSPFSFQKIMDVFQCEGPKCLYVADNPAKDFVAAKNHNWRTVQIARKDGEYSGISVDEKYQADEIIHTLYDLEVIVK